MLIFISSTYKDLESHRSTVGLSLDMSRIPYNAMEHFGAKPNTPLKTCLDAVRKCNVFIGIIGVRYGASPPRCKLSFTEREYRLAKRLKKTIFMFLIDDRNAAVAPQLITGETADQQTRLSKFKKIVSSHHTVTFFTTPEDLARLILASLIGHYGMVR